MGHLKAKAAAMLFFIFILCSGYSQDQKIINMEMNQAAVTRQQVSHRLSNDMQPSIQIIKDKLTMEAGTTYPFRCIYYPPDASPVPLWSSTNPRVASVEPYTGVVTAHTFGQVRIFVTFSYEGGIYSDIFTLNITPSGTDKFSSGIYKIKNNKTGKFLEVQQNGTLILTNDKASNSDGGLLWFIEYDSPNYMIYSFGKKYENGSHEAVLASNSMANILINGENQNYTTWILSYYNYKYYFSPKNLPNKSLSVNPKTNVLYLSDTVSSSNDDWSLIHINEKTFNNYWDGTYNGQGNIKQVKVKLDSSIPASDKSYFNAVNRWSGVSYVLSLYDPDDSVPTGTPFNVTFKYSTNSSLFNAQAKDSNGAANSVTLAAVTTPYKRIGIISVEANVNSNWDYVTVFINTSSTGHYLSSSADRKRQIIAHEMGHALKMAHPNDKDIADVDFARGAYNDINNVASIMNNSGDAANPNNNACVDLTTFDIINFKNKWG